MSDQSYSLERPTFFAPSKVHAWLTCFSLSFLPLLFSYRFWPGHDPIADPASEQFRIVLFAQLCLITLSGVLRTPVKQWGVNPILLLTLVPLAIQAWHTFLQADMLAISSLIRWSVLVAFGTAIYIGIRNRHIEITNQMAGLTVIVAALIYITVFAIVYSDATERDHLQRVVIGFINIRYTSHFTAPAMAILIAMSGCYSILSRKYAVLGCLAIILSTFAFYTGTRGTIASVTVTAIMLTLFSPGLRLWRALLLLLISLAAGYVLAGLAPPPESGSYMISGRLDRMDSGRIAMWLTLLEYWMKAPLLGFGEIDIGPIVGSFVAQAHNSVIQNLISVGLIGSFAIWTLVALMFWRILHALQNEDDQSLPTIAGISCIFANSMLGGSLFAPYPLALCAVMIAAFLANRPTTQNSAAAAT
ncbi:O-antigen ligase [Notoacmeibacter sp. MSK16QG-6]|uniref:O-antigen ligase family protein n=1 Tax=Notoacmeibacter sp. MSK16QG-6 TaxID=2957982 RepID=UPI00209D47B4|nr:O-antigen ligase family protein [Notoacmeibacter sp. MSK16QG-6]MCP1198080.1 O-antigen ligase family protein [Notoacmeibacter sp. MSK16QG-6]